MYRANGHRTAADHACAGFSREALLLLLCARTAIADQDAAKIRALVEQDLDWASVIRQARLHGVNPLLYHSLNSICPELVPKECMQQIQERFATNALWTLRRSGELIRLVAACDAEGILAIPIKGPVLAVQAYGDVALREFVDLDLLVHPRDLERAAAVLRAHGYTQRSNLSGDEIVFARQDGYDMVELHGCLVAHWRLRRSFALDVDALRPRLVPVALVGNRCILTLSPEDLLLALCVHGCSHHWSRLSWIADVAELLRGQGDLDWTALLARAHELGSERMLLLGLRLAHDLLGAELPAPVRARVLTSPVQRLADQVTGWLFSEDSHVIGLTEEARFFIHSREYWRDRLPYIDLFLRAHLMAALKPTQRDRDRVSLPDSLSLLYYIIRPFRIASHFLCQLLRRA
jgi:hypothetical protein